MTNALYGINLYSDAYWYTMRIRLDKFDNIRSTVLLAGPSNFDDQNKTYHIAIGQQGIIIEVWNDGEAYEVEFLLGEREPDGFVKNPDWVVMTLKPDQIELDPTAS